MIIQQILLRRVAWKSLFVLFLATHSRMVLDMPVTLHSCIGAIFILLARMHLSPPCDINDVAGRARMGVGVADIKSRR